MKQGFWSKLHKPILALAPMEDVTDSAFRQIIVRYGKPDVMFTEFVSVEGLGSEGRDRLLVDFQFVAAERPIVAQIFGSHPDNFREVAKLIVQLGFDGIDINMGCPDKTIMKQGSCSALIDQPQLAREIIRATREGAGPLPVSVKTRLGTRSIVIEEWIRTLLAMEPALITIHGRTAKEMSKVPVHWDAVARAVAIRNELKSETLIMGNGDIRNRQEALEKVAQYGLDGAMLGRAIFGNPWRFHPTLKKEDIPLEKILNVLLEHTFLFEKLYKGKRNFAIMKKHFASYVQGFPGVKKLRADLMLTRSSQEVADRIHDFARAHNLVV